MKAWKRHRINSTTEASRGWFFLSYFCYTHFKILAMNEKKILIGIIALSIIGVAVWMFLETKPKPGQMQEDKGRTHVEIGTQVDYHTVPPTSGPHYAQWTKWGVYDIPKDDRNLVHALEHGYVIMSYNCNIEQESSLFENRQWFSMAQSVNPLKVKSASAQMDNTPMSVASDSTELDASAAATLSEAFKSDSCLDLANKLKEIYDAKGQVRLIVVPNPKIDTRIALSAWRYLDKFNNFDKKRIEKFIGAHFNQGPEKTIE